MKKGFTLIEVLIVVAIIAILSSVILIGLGPAQRAGRDSRRIADMRQAQSGLELYFNKCGYYPGTAACAANTVQTAFAAAGTAVVGSAIGVSQWPVDPTNSGIFGYLYGGNANAATTYTIGAQLEDNSNPALKTSLGGTTNGVACGVPTTSGIYCVSL